jgi:hypothetical protein
MGMTNSYGSLISSTIPLFNCVVYRRLELAQSLAFASIVCQLPRATAASARHLKTWGKARAKTMTFLFDYFFVSYGTKM